MRHHVIDAIVSGMERIGGYMLGESMRQSTLMVDAEIVVLNARNMPEFAHLEWLETLTPKPAMCDHGNDLECSACEEILKAYFTSVSLQGVIEECWKKYSEMWEPFRTSSVYQGIYSLDNKGLVKEDYSL